MAKKRKKARMAYRAEKRAYGGPVHGDVRDNREKGGKGPEIKILAPEKKNKPQQDNKLKLLSQVRVARRRIKLWD